MEMIMNYVAIATIAAAYIAGLALQCLLWFAAYKAGLLIAALLLSLAALIFSGIGFYAFVNAASDDAEKALVDVLERTKSFTWKDIVPQ
jgi:membrane-associated phospholipid phosphatase